MRCIFVVALVWTSFSGPALAQRANENAVRTADDAFGLSIGNERLGLYAEDNVRGFSPASAGNLRIEGIYYDRRGTLSARLLRGSTIRVGLTAQGYAFPAPSGIVDYTLRVPSGSGAVSLVGTTDSWGRAGLELDADLRVSEQLSVGGGLSRYLEPLASGSDRDVLSGALIANWRPAGGVELTTFISAARSANDEAGPLVFTGGPYLPSMPKARRFYGQDWTDTDIVAVNYGVLGKANLPFDLDVRAGVFHSEAVRDPSFVDLFLATDQAGRATRQIISYPEQENASNSGEVQLLRRLRDGERRYTFLVSVRGRHSWARYGGGAAATFNDAQVGQAVSIPQPVTRFGPVDRDDVRQWTIGSGVQALWPRVGELNLGLQATQYDRHFRPVVGSSSESAEQHVLWSANAAAYVRPWLTLFGGYTRGLEDGGIAPANATNANAILPASISTQGDAGLRINAGGVKLVGAAFHLEKPYYALDAQNAFSRIGRLKSSGLEVSVTATPAPGLKLVGGVVVSKPRVTGLDLNDGLMPVGAAERIGKASVDYAFPRWPAWSADVALAYLGRRAVRIDNRAFIPDRAVLDMGARYRFKVRDMRATMRVAVFNVTNTRSWAVTPGGGLFLEDPRRILFSLYADF